MGHQDRFELLSATFKSEVKFLIYTAPLCLENYHFVSTNDSHLVDTDIYHAGINWQSEVVLFHQWSIRYVRSKISEKEITNLELIWANRSEVDNTSVTLKVTLKTGLYHKVSALYEWDLQFEKWSLPYGIHFLSVWSAIWLVAFTGSIADFLVRHGRENVEFFFSETQVYLSRYISQAQLRKTIFECECLAFTIDFL